MPLIRFIATASAVALIACPAIASAQGDPAAPAPPAAAAPPATPALPSIPKVAGGDNIYDVLKASGQFTILLKAVDQANLAAVLKTYPHLTLFAPTDAAFNALPPAVLTDLMAPNDKSANALQRILAYHLVNAQVDASQIRGHKGPVVSAETSPVTIDGSNPDDLLVNNADIIQADIRTANGGVVNVIDKVLVPPDSPYYAQLNPAPAPPAPATPTAQ